MAEEPARAVTNLSGAAVSSVSSATPGTSTGDITHAFRPNLFTREHRYVLQGDTLIWSDGRTEERLPLSDVKRIRLYAVPSGAGPMLRRTVLKFRSGRKRVLQGGSYVRLGVLEDRGESYRSIVEALVQRTCAVNPQVEVLVGPPTGIWAFWLITFVGAVLVLIMGLLMFAFGDFPIQAALFIGLILMLLPLNWRVVSKGRPRRVDPKQLPPYLFQAE